MGSPPRPPAAVETLTPAIVAERLTHEGWRGFSLLRRYLTEHPGDSRLLGRALRSVPWLQRPDAESRTARFGFLSDGVMANLDDALLLECLARGVLPRTVHAPHNVSREVRDPASVLWTHHPDVVVVAVSPAHAPGVEGARFLDALMEDLQILRRRSEAVLLVHDFAAPDFQPLGLRDGREPDGRGEVHARLNVELRQRCREIQDTCVIDVGRLAQLSGARWSTFHKTWFMASFVVPEPMAPLLAREYAAAGAAVRGLVRKCLVVDLDDTLWGGVVGEVGVGEVEVGSAFPGNVYREIQRVIAQLHARGVVLAVNSRNDEEDAWKPFESRPEMVLRRDSFAAARINWGDKVANLRELARELNLGLDSFVVLDDDAVVRSWIEEQLPEVHVFPVSDPLDMLHTLATTRLFDDLSGTAEADARGRSYSVAALRRCAEDTAADRESFLAGLELAVTVGRARGEQLPRLAQVSQRTNQFNLTTRRYTQAQLAVLASDPDHEVLYCACRDRFADEGVIGLVVLKRGGREWRIDTLAVSCRVLGRGVEAAVAAAVCRMAAESGASDLLGEYIPTPKNGQTEWFYRDLGFARAGSTGAGTAWRLPLPPAGDLRPAWIELRTTTEPE